MSGSQADRQLPLPSVLYLETTNRCNLRCKGCILYRGSWEPDRDVSLNELVTITDQLPALERVFLHGIGEPLLNKELIEMIRYLKQRRVYVLFNSNGVLLDKRKQQYLELQAMLQKKGPFVIMFQQNEQVARRKNLKGFVSGSNFDLVFYRNVTKQ